GGREYRKGVGELILRHLHWTSWAVFAGNIAALTIKGVLAAQVKPGQPGLDTPTPSRYQEVPL
ncbi:MAG: hypothetical protein PVG03_07255, partial [Desulfarculaceae bacterium]